MIKIKTTLAFLLISMGAIDFCYAQTNSFPNEGNVGIGTLYPNHKLEVIGNGFFYGGLYSNLSQPDIGGRLSLMNPTKSQPGAASNWTIYNMSGGYGNSLQFWAYDNLGCLDGGMCASRFTIMDNGNVGIGINNPADKLAVNGQIRAREIKVEATGWPDYVFSPKYSLPSLDNVASYIKANGHLPGIPSAENIDSDGVALGEMNKLLLKKIEELTLYLIEKEKQLMLERKANRENASRIFRTEQNYKKLAKAVSRLKTNR